MHIYHKEKTTITQLFTSVCLMIHQIMLCGLEPVDSSKTTATKTVSECVRVEISNTENTVQICVRYMFVSFDVNCLIKLPPAGSL